jgi:cytochrome c nitrite reductase small subunit
MAEPETESPTRVDRSRSKTWATWWPLGLSLVLGAFAGIGAYTFSYAEGLSYFSTDPKACVNCHIMQPQYDGWQKASHHAVAVCVDCHLPQSFIPKYLAKAENGWRHGQKFTTQNFQEPIFVQAAGLRILQDNCVRCHEPLVHSIREDDRRGTTVHPAHANTGLSDTLLCIHCHAWVGHGQRTALGGPLRAAELEYPPPVSPGIVPHPPLRDPADTSASERTRPKREVSP